jgi:hypothetical protein
MRSGVNRLGIAVLAAMIIGSLAVAVPTAGAAKKGGGAVNLTKVVNQAIPDQTSFAALRVPLTSTITVGKRFRGRKIRDVNVTAQTAGASGSNPAFDLTARLTGPNGATTQLWSNGRSGSSIGPLTLDDESPLRLGSGPPVDPQALYAPYVGVAQPFSDPLAVMDGGPVRGTWTFEIVDILSMSGNQGTSNLVQWRLNVATGKPFRTK